MTEQLTFGKIQLKKVKPDQPLLIIADSLKIMKGFPRNSIDLIIDDVGYDDLEKDREIGTTTRLTEKSGTKWFDLVSYFQIMPIYSRILDKGRHIYFWRPSFNQGSIENWSKLIDPNSGILIKYDFILRKIIPVLKKSPGMGYSWRSQHEMLLYAINSGREKRNLNNKALKDFFDVEWIHPLSKNRVHTSEKPLEAYRLIIENSSKPNDIVLEPFAGSFQSAIANVKYNLKRKIIGIEIDEENAMNAYNNFKKICDKPLEIMRL